MVDDEDCALWDEEDTTEDDMTSPPPLPPLAAEENEADIVVSVVDLVDSLYARKGMSFI